MLVARLHGPGDIRLHDEPVPEEGMDEELVQVEAVGLCGSDRHWFVEGSIGDAQLSRPLVLGHEIGGVISSGPRRGVRVAIDPADPCGTCSMCLSDKEHLCASLRFAGHSSVDGGLRSQMSWPMRLLHPVPETISDVEVPLLEPLGVALHAIDLAGIQPGISAAVVGCGPIGLLLIHLLRLTGAEPVLAADPLIHRLDAAIAFGATPIPVNAHVDVAFDASGERAAVQLAIDLAAPGGRVVLAGIPTDDKTEFRASVARRKELSIAVVRRMRGNDMERAIALAAGGRVKLAPLVTKSVPLSEVQDAFRALVDHDGIKTVVRPTAAES